MPTAIQDLEIVLIVLLIFVVGFGALANRLKTPYPILLVIGGLVLSLVEETRVARIGVRSAHKNGLPPVMIKTV